MSKDTVYENILSLINNGFFQEKYNQETEGVFLSDPSNPNYEETKNKLEEVSANIFNAILIGSQLFDDIETIKKFVDLSWSSLNASTLEFAIHYFNISEDEALERLRHGFGVHFTTAKICEEIKKSGHLVHFGENAMLTKEEDEMIEEAARIQKQNDPESIENLNYLFKGWGTGVSSYGALTNGFWMYHTPESLSFLFGDISKRNKEDSMNYVLKVTSALNPEEKKKIFNVMSSIYDRLIGEEQEVGCILIDRDSFEYEVDYYYDTGTPVPVERRPYSKNYGFNSITGNDKKITNDIDVNDLRFLKIPTVIELERRKINQKDNNIGTL